MNLLDLREPVSALSHAAGGIVAVPAALRLWLLGGPGRGRRAALGVFGASLVFCLFASAAYHGSHADPGRIEQLRRLDHVGIYVLIAGTYTPITVMLLPAPTRRRVLGVIWAVAAAGSAWSALLGIPPSWVFTSVYLGMGWGGVELYRRIARERSKAFVRPLVWGGVAYSVGAVLNAAAWPVVWAGVLGPHELFHGFVLAGAGCHFQFVARATRATAPTAVPARSPHLGHAVSRQMHERRGRLASPRGMARARRGG